MMSSTIEAGAGGWSPDFGLFGNSKRYASVDQLNWNHKMATTTRDEGKGNDDWCKTLSMGIGWTGHFCGKNTETGISHYIFGETLWIPNVKKCKLECETYPMCACHFNSSNVFAKLERCGKERIRLTIEPKASVFDEAMKLKVNHGQKKVQQPITVVTGENRFAYPQHPSLLNPLPLSTPQRDITTQCTNRNYNENMYLSRNQNDSSNGYVPQMYPRDDFENFEYDDDWSRWELSNQWTQDEFFIDNNETMCNTYSYN